MTSPKLLAALLTGFSLAVVTFVSLGAIRGAPPIQAAPARPSPPGAVRLATQTALSQPFLVRDIHPGPENADPAELTSVGSRLFFVADDGSHGEELWVSRGSFFNTTLVKDIYPGSGGDANVSQLIALSDTLFFRADDGSHGTELWKSDGTATGTMMITDINASPSVYPYGLSALNGALYFQANDGRHGYEPWHSDGTPTGTGTLMISDIYSGSTGSSPQDFTAVGSAIFFHADDSRHGTELWVMGPAPVVLSPTYLPLILRHEP